MKRIDIIVDLETLGKGSNAPIFQIGALAFDINSGKVLSSYNEKCDIGEFNNIEGDTLKWWLGTNSKLLSKLITEEPVFSTEKDLIRNFVNWIIDFKQEAEVFLWGNGILFDNRIIKEKCDFYNINYPIHYRNDRDLRTICELAAIISGYKDDCEFRQSIDKSKVEHNGFYDAVCEKNALVAAYNLIIKKT